MYNDCSGGICSPFSEPSGQPGCYYNYTYYWVTGSEGILYQMPTVQLACNQGGGQSGGPNGQAGATAAPSNEVHQNPCDYAGRNLDPSAWAATGQSTRNNPFTTTYDFMHGFSIGGYLDAQPMATGSTYQKAAYGNYVFGAYMSAAGFPLSVALAGANEIAFYHSLSNPSQYSGRQMDSFFWSLPAANVANISAGYSAQRSGTLCHK